MVARLVAAARPTRYCWNRYANIDNPGFGAVIFRAPGRLQNNSDEGGLFDTQP